MEGWETALVGFFGVILGVGIQEFRRWRESKEVYQHMVFQKRLETHQKAFEWCQKLSLELSRSEADQIHKVAIKFRDWWNANCFYLDPKSRIEIIPLINYAHQYTREPKRVDIWGQLEKVEKAITTGIGREYIPKSLREMRY